MKKKFLSVLLALCIVLGTCPIGAMAEIEPVGKLKGTVTDAVTGQPLSDVYIYVYYDVGFTAGFMGPFGVTDSQGQYLLETMIDNVGGDWRAVEFRRDGYRTVHFDSVLISPILSVDGFDVQMYPDSGTGVNPGEIVDSGKCGENVFWTYYADGTLYISGEGRMYDYAWNDLPQWQRKYGKKIVKVCILEGVTTIGAYSFDGCSSLVNVTVPNSVTSLGEAAFAYCSSLVHITLPNSVATIGERAFVFCRSLVSVTFTNGVTSIGDSAFYNCGSLVSVTFPYGVTSIGDSAFYNCGSLVSVTLPNSIATIGEQAFKNCGVLTDVKLPNRITVIGKETFRNCHKLKSVTIPDSVIRIDAYAFYSCWVADVYYSGTAEQWRQLNNTPYGTIHYNSTGPDHTPGATPTPTISPNPTTKPTTKPTTPPVYDTELTQLASQWTRAYDQYTDSIKTTLEKNAGAAVHGDNLDNLARKLESNYGAVVSGYGLTKEQKVVVYKALLKMLAQETGYQLNFSGVSMSKLDKVPSAICTAVANGIGSSTYTHTEAGGKKVEISLSSNFGTNFGLANYYEKGKFVNSVVISTTKKDVEKIVSQYMTDLLDMEADALQQAAKEAYKDLSKAFFGATPDSFSKKIVKSGVEKISANLAKYKLGDVAKIAANCYNYYGFIKGIQKGESTEKLLSMLAGQTDITFSDPNAKEIATQKALKLMEKTRKEIEKKLKKEPTGIGSFFAKILGWRVSDFNCPINIAVYDGANNQVGYIGDDNEWFDEEIIYIERNGDTKTIYSKEPVSFKVTGTDYGTLNYTVEEFKNGVPIGRTNFFDIDLYEGIKIDISVPNDAVSGNSLDMVVDGTTYLTLDNISADEYDSAKVTINGYAESSVGGIVSGFGEYVKGDTVKLLAQANTGYVFLGWKDSNGNLIGVSPTLELIAKKNSTYAAQFEKSTNPDNPEDEPTAIPEPTNTPTPTSTPAPTASPIPEPTATPNPAETTFPDVPQSAYYYEAVKWAVGKKIVAGYPDGRFKPDNVCTRAEAMMIFYRAVGSPDVQLDNLKFTDVGMDHWANTAICWAVEHGITSGTSSNTFSPNNKLTRAQAMTFLYRMAGSPQISGNNPFKDIKSSSYYYNPVMWAVDAGITAGTSKTQFSPNKDCTRAQIVTFLYRYLVKATESPNRELTEDECWKIATAHWNSLIVPGKTTVFHASKKESFDGKIYYHYYLNQFVDSYWSAIDYLFVDISNGDCYFGVQRPEYKV